MTAPNALESRERRILLDALASLKADDDDAVQQDAKWFLPLDAHARALRHETLIVRGGRGSGKTALFHFLAHVREQPELIEKLGFRIPTATLWVEGFSSQNAHPSLPVVARFGLEAAEDLLRHFWFAWLCARLSHATARPLPPGELATAVAGRSAAEPETLAKAAAAQLSPLTAWLDDIDRTSKQTVVVSYDSLDRFLAGAKSSSDQLTRSLLAMWLSLADRYRRIRPKIFVREDLLQRSLTAFPDASKLGARSTSLDWRVEDLYRVLIKHMANTSDDLRKWIERDGRGIPLRRAGPLGWIPPDVLPETGKASQKIFADNLTGEQMGAGPKKGFTYRWIPNRLQDAHARVVPRSMLSLTRHAADFALQRGPRAQRRRLLTPDELQGALEFTSKDRVNELKEEFPVVARLENLKETSVMLDRAEAVERLSNPPHSVNDEQGSDGEAVLRILIELGVMSVRPDQRLDIPDIYRYGFGIKRKGGVRRPR